MQQLQEELENRIKIVNLLVLNAKFSDYLVGLSEAAIPDAWFSAIHFSTGEARINLRGFALESMQVRQLLDELSKQAVFSRLIFNLQELKEATPDQKKIVSFHITTQLTNST